MCNYSRKPHNVQWHSEIFERLQALTQDEIDVQYQWLVDRKFADACTDANKRREVVRSIRYLQLWVGKYGSSNSITPTADPEFEKLCSTYSVKS